MKNLIVILLMLTATFSFSQRMKVVVLKNGSEIRGRVVDSETDKVKLQKSDGSIMVFDQTEVQSVEEFGSKVSRSGYFFRFDGGILGGADDASPSLHVVNGYAINNRWQLGVSTGIESMRGDGYLPTYLTARMYLLKDRKSSPFIYGKSGYALPVTNWNSRKGGYIGGVGMGISHGFQIFGQLFEMNTSVGYRFGWLRQTGWWDDFMEVTQINRFEIRFGLTIR